MTTQKKNLLSAASPSGDLTIGNYIGAITNWDALQKEFNCYYMVVDLHSITARQDPIILRNRLLSFFAQYIACGLDPDKNTIYLQSHVAEHAELAWILNCYTPFGDLTRMTQFKDKSAKNPKNINAGLFNYPVLMAADILLFDTHLVPVGEDQKQHLELTRDIAMRFNNEYGETFVMPEMYVSKVGARVMSLLEPERKMDKSDPNTNNSVYLLDDPKLVEKKFKSATTDSGSEIRAAADKPGVTNLLQIFASMTGKTVTEAEQHFAGKMYGHLKIETAQATIEKFRPVRAKYDELMKDHANLTNIMKRNAERAREHASKTLARVYDKLGFLPK